MAGDFDHKTQNPESESPAPQTLEQRFPLPSRKNEDGKRPENAGSLATELISVGSWGSNLDTLLHELHDLTSADSPSPVIGRSLDNQLVQVRLGIATSLFTALRCRDPLTAAHALRVALITSAWCLKMELPDHQRDVIEVAALLHDLGVIAVPDKVLHKPGNLDYKEATVVERSRQMSVEILREACSEPLLLEIVEHIPTHYDGSRNGYRKHGEDIPLGARIIAIVESFDSMTSDHVFRPAMSHEAALSELFDCAGGQFDPHLVEEFALLQSCDQSAYREEAASRWLHGLDPEAVESYWELSQDVCPRSAPGKSSLFESKLFGNMHDAVIFVDDSLTVTFWNHGAERMTGITGSSICHRNWTPKLLSMVDEAGRYIEDEDCPVACVIASGVQSLRRLTIQGRNGRPLSVDAHIIPVLNESKTPLGVALLMHDASSETSLEERCQNLHEKSTKDPMTQVGNRAEFDRVHEQFVGAHLQQQRPCSLIICDLDLFKRVNDTYGHQAGDDVIISMANVLKDSCRAGDLVARYGGEEFVMLCADCDNATAARRAEQIRKNICQIPQKRMGGKTVSASFGVTEIQPGDSPDTMLRRADRALLTAKARGRNCVVQLGTGSSANAFEKAVGEELKPGADARILFEQNLYTSVPIGVAVEKLRGFVADHRAKLIDANGPNVQLEIVTQTPQPRRRQSDRPNAFLVDLRFEECQDDVGRGASKDKPSKFTGRLARTRIHFEIRSKNKRDRRSNDMLHHAREVLVSFRSYLMVIDGEQLAKEQSISQTRHFQGSWLSDQLTPLLDEHKSEAKPDSLWRKLFCGQCRRK